MATMKSALVSNYENEQIKKSQLSSLRKTRVYFVTLYQQTYTPQIFAGRLLIGRGKLISQKKVKK
jgi:hypothetical protein